MAEAELGIDDLLPAPDGDVANIFQRVAYAWQRLEIPVIAALHGACFGGGAQIALGADVRIASFETRISVMEIKYGLIPDMGISQALPTLVPLDVAKELTWSGRIVEAEEAAQLGLVTRLAHDSHEIATVLAGEIAERSPDAIRAAKRLLNDAYRGRSEDLLAVEAKLQGELIGSPNQIAAVTAAMTKKPADFADPE
jgi:enoyl-CoA hydratase/carnithine racemase